MSATFHAMSSERKQPGRPPGRLPALLCMLVAGGVCFGATSAGAQAEDRNSIALERFSTPLDASGFGTTRGGEVIGHLELTGGMLGHYQLNPLTVRRRDGGRIESIVQNRVTADVFLAVGLFDLVELGAAIPVMLWQNPGSTFASVADQLQLSPTVATTGIGDLRLVPKFRVLRQDRHYVNVSVLSTVTVPTSISAQLSPFVFEYGGGYLGEGSAVVTAAPEVAISANYLGIRVAANLGWKLRPPVQYSISQVESEIFYRAGIGYDVGKWIPPPGQLWGDPNGGVRPLWVFAETFGGTRDRNPFAIGDLIIPSSGPLDDLLRSRERAIHNALEGGVGVRWHPFGAWSVEAGITGPMIGGFGVPDLRVYGGIRYTYEQLDDDGDGIEDDVDACPLEAEDLDNFDDADGCPDRDDDGDGIPDAIDSCRLEVEDVDGHADADGCPDPDNDGDGVLDGDDKCPDRAGPASAAGCPKSPPPPPPPPPPTPVAPPDGDGDGVADADDLCPTILGDAASKRPGCPLNDPDADGVEDPKDACPLLAGRISLAGCPDDDGDGIANAKDKCPKEPETINGNKDDDGCPDAGKSLVVVRGDKIDLGETVYFGSGNSTIQKRSFPLLDQIAQVLRAHPEIKGLEIAGHTDSGGSDAVNQELSTARAVSVRDSLVTRGVDTTRLSAKGYGEKLPIADNGTPEGRAKNRRVELVITGR